MKGNVDLLGVLWMVYGLLQMAVGALIALMYGGLGGLMGVIGASEGDDEALIIGGVFLFAAVVLAFFIFLFAMLPVITGLGLRRRAPWARIAGFVCAAMAVFNLPLGTLLGVFTFATLADSDVAAEFTG